MFSLRLLNDLPDFNESGKYKVVDNWFHVTRIGNGVIALAELFTSKQVISYLIYGTEKVVLFNTGMGIKNIKEVVERLANKPIIVINSHLHFDHIGCDSLFPEVYVYGSDAAQSRIRKGYTADEIRSYAEKIAFEKVPDGFDRNNYHILPGNPVPVFEGDTFQLGGRYLEILHTPGHSEDCIMLLDRKNGMLFVGDIYYPSSLFAHPDDDVSGHSNIKDYAETMGEIYKLVPDLKTIHPSHIAPVAKPEILRPVKVVFK